MMTTKPILNARTLILFIAAETKRQLIK